MREVRPPEGPRRPAAAGVRGAPGVSRVLMPRVQRLPAFGACRRQRCRAVGSIAAVLPAPATAPAARLPICLPAHSAQLQRRSCAAAAQRLARPPLILLRGYVCVYICVYIYVCSHICPTSPPHTHPHTRTHSHSPTHPLPRTHHYPADPARRPRGPRAGCGRGSVSGAAGGQADRLLPVRAGGSSAGQLMEG